MANYWIKLYHEILDDPLMATMPDRLWRRTIELFLVCGRFSDDGCLPNSKHIAWILRADTTSIENDLKEIAALGIITETETGWAVKNFKKRQAPSSSTERSKAFREKKRADQYYCNAYATETQRNVAQITDTDNRLDTDNRSDQKEIEPQKPEAPILDSEQALFDKAISITNQKLELTEGRRRVIRDIRTNVHGGSDKFLTAVRNMMSSPTFPKKSVTYFLDKPFDAINRIDEFANSPPANGPPGTRTMSAPPEIVELLRKKTANAATP